MLVAWILANKVWRQSKHAAVPTCAVCRVQSSSVGNEQHKVRMPYREDPFETKALEQQNAWHKALFDCRQNISQTVLIIFYSRTQCCLFFSSLLFSKWMACNSGVKGTDTCMRNLPVEVEFWMDGNSRVSYSTLILNCACVVSLRKYWTLSMFLHVFVVCIGVFLFDACQVRAVATQRLSCRSSKKHQLHQRLAPCWSAERKSAVSDRRVLGRGWKTISWRPAQMRRIHRKGIKGSNLRVVGQLMLLHASTATHMIYCVYFFNIILFLRIIYRWTKIYVWYASYKQDRSLEFKNQESVKSQAERLVIVGSAKGLVGVAPIETLSRLPVFFWSSGFGCPGAPENGRTVVHALEQVGHSLSTHDCWIEKLKGTACLASEAYANLRIEASQVAFFKRQKKLGVWRNMFIRVALMILTGCSTGPTSWVCASHPSSFRLKHNMRWELLVVELMTFNCESLATCMLLLQI